MESIPSAGPKTQDALYRARLTGAEHRVAGILNKTAYLTGDARWLAVPSLDTNVLASGAQTGRRHFPPRPPTE